MITDADIEMLELAAAAAEDAADTCNACGEIGESVTFYDSPARQRPPVAVYECICGHRAVWINNRRLS